MITVVTTPMFLFSGTFFPITVYPDWLRILVELTPLYRGVHLLRSFTTGVIEPTGAHRHRLPVDHERRRRGHHLAPAAPPAAEVARAGGSTPVSLHAVHLPRWTMPTTTIWTGGHAASRS